jgi:uncharacterized repeat protein (TIGR03803 family)
MRRLALPLLMRLICATALLLPAFVAQAGVVFTTLHSFGVFTNGEYPEAGLVQGSDGNFYGTTDYGGTNGSGTVFKISTNGALTILHSFTGGIDGANPQAGLVQGSDGYFYGTTEYGGTNNLGTVFKISTNGALTSLHSFTGGDDGGGPNGLMLGSDGNFYGTTGSGGGPSEAGTVFRISTNGDLTNLYSFTGSNDGASPAAGLVQGSDGSLYGTTQNGGTTNYNGLRDGTVFKITTNGALTTLYTFTGNDGASPQAALVQGSDGYFYGTTPQGGSNNLGTLFKISANGKLTSLYSFTGGNDGWNPDGALVQGSDGYLYGTTAGVGYLAFESGHGTVFKFTTNGALTTLYSFTGLSDGAYPVAGLVQGSDGNLYGTTTQGGGSHGIDSLVPGFGNVFQISTNGALTSLYSFSADTDGASPNTGLVQGSDGYLYGTAAGTVFKISTNGGYTSLHVFTGGNDGYGPNGLVQGSDGSFYGTTSGSDGGPNYGTVFKIDTQGALTTLYAFGTVTDADGDPLDGANPRAGLMQGSDGYFYGTTSFGGTNFEYARFGTVFKIGTNGALTTLYSFTDGNDGNGPVAGLAQASDGNFYGTAEAGGVGGAGTVFRLTIVPEFRAVTLTKSTLNLTWSTEAGGTYQLQYSSDLSSSNWINLRSPVTAAGATLSATDSLTNGPQRFYRLMLLP